LCALAAALSGKGLLQNYVPNSIFVIGFCRLRHFIAPCILSVFFSSPPFFQRFHLSIRVPSNSKHNARGISLLPHASHIPYSWNCCAVLVCQLTTRH